MDFKIDEHYSLTHYSSFFGPLSSVACFCSCEEAMKSLKLPRAPCLCQCSIMQCNTNIEIGIELETKVREDYTITDNHG